MRRDRVTRRIQPSRQVIGRSLLVLPPLMRQSPPVTELMSNGGLLVEPLPHELGLFASPGCSSRQTALMSQLLFEENIPAAEVLGLIDPESAKPDFRGSPCCARAARSELSSSYICLHIEPSGAMDGVVLLESTLSIEIIFHRGIVAVCIDHENPIHRCIFSMALLHMQPPVLLKQLLGFQEGVVPLIEQAWCVDCPGTQHCTGKHC
mmetsp:Transcript_121529/g.170989  ORF Transcript_121529/g.170989 Transcript_121529/m.170989 type:complete len:207 (-) Transcript_121529:8-628(-)